MGLLAPRHLKKRFILASSAACLAALLVVFAGAPATALADEGGNVAFVMETQVRMYFATDTVDPEDPVVPDDPADPEEPVGPDDPAVPDDPANPDDPAASGDPAGSDGSGEDGVAGALSHLKKLVAPVAASAATSPVTGGGTSAGIVVQKAADLSDDGGEDASPSLTWGLISLQADGFASWWLLAVLAVACAVASALLAGFGFRQGKNERQRV